MSIKISEIFGGNKKGGTIQGEGMWCGTPSVFVRVFGCNKRCENFGCPPGEKSQERFKVDPTKYSKFEELPIISSGCDTYGSIDPRFSHLSPEQSIEQIVDRVQNLLQDGKFTTDCHLILTGGEPLLGYQKQYPELLQEIKHRNMHLTDLTFETNGTKLLSKELKQCLADHHSLFGLKTTFSVSAKLPCSGETWESSILPQVVMDYTRVTDSNVFLKFVVSNEEDLLDVKRAEEEYRAAGFKGSVYLMPEGGTEDNYWKNAKRVAELAIENGYRFSPRLQCELFKNGWNF